MCYEISYFCGENNKMSDMNKFGYFQQVMKFIIFATPMKT